jgi:ZIP family zinc transporter
VNALRDLHPVLQSLLAGIMTWGLTAAGAALVFFAKQPSRKIMDGMLGFAAGVMIAASFWSLLAPAIELAEADPGGLPAWAQAALGFLGGGVFLRIVDRLLPHMHPAFAGNGEVEGIKTSLQRTTLLVMAITLHNIPEGLAVGVAFGAAAVGMPEATLAGAFALALGIGIQNFPEGTAVSMPLRREGLPRGRAFAYGQASAIVEPIAAVLGAAIVIQARALLPYALAFAAGAMIFVVTEELTPEAHRGPHSHFATAATMVGFAVMMILDVALG